jgi:hypothetical protein
VWLRLVSHRAAAELLELELVAEPDQVAAGLWLEGLAAELRPGDRLVVTLVLAAVPANDPTRTPTVRPERRSGSRTTGGDPGQPEARLARR